MGTSGGGFKDWGLSLAYGSCIVIQMVVTYYRFNVFQSMMLVRVGQVLWVISALFGWLPIMTFRKLGEVPKGKSYINTTKLVDTGLYSIVRHPQFLAWITMSIALVLLSQHWSTFVLFIPVYLGTVYDVKRADERLVIKFGPVYSDYAEKVPGLNIVKGLIRLLRM